MTTGLRGTFVISWAQTEIDGLAEPPLHALRVGAAWSWKGDSLQLDGPQDVLRLNDPEGREELRRRAAGRMQRLIGNAVEGLDLTARKPRAEDPAQDEGFAVTDGSRSYSGQLIRVRPDEPPLLLFRDQLPPRGKDLWVVHHSMDTTSGALTGADGGGVICFTPGTMIATPQGPRAVEDLRPGDQVETCDNGNEEILWICARRMSGARLHAMPHLRPIRIRAGALSEGRPGEELLVSPQHRMLIRGREAQLLFGTPEVLVTAEDLVNGSSIAVDHALSSVTYIHMMLPRHRIILANGVETESFHPASTALETLGEESRSQLAEVFPQAFDTPHLYGPYARRCLSAPEAAILRHKDAA